MTKEMRTKEFARELGDLVEKYRPEVDKYTNLLLYGAIFMSESFFLDLGCDIEIMENGAHPNYPYIYIILGKFGQLNFYHTATPKFITDHYPEQHQKLFKKTEVKDE